MTRITLMLIILAIASASGAQDPEVSADALEEQIWELRLQASYAEAAELAGKLVALRKGDPEARPFEIADAEGLVETLQHIAGLPDEVIRELAQADSLRDVIKQHRQEGRPYEEEAAARRQLEIRERHLGEEHPDIGRSLSDLSVALQIQGRFAEAEEVNGEALRIRRQALGSMHPDVAGSLSNLSLLLTDVGDYAAAERALQEAADIFVTNFGEQHFHVATALNGLGRLNLHRGDPVAAEGLFRKAAHIITEELGSDHPAAAQVLHNLTIALRQQGDHVCAEPLAREILASRRRTLGDQHPDVASSLIGLGLLFCEQSDCVAAEPLFREALSIYRSSHGERSVPVAYALSNLGKVSHDGTRDYARAEELFRESLSILEEVFGPSHPDVARILSNLASALEAQHHYNDAEGVARRALGLKRELLGETHASVGTSLANLAVLLWNTERIEEAEDMYHEALATFRKTVGDQSADTADALRSLGKLALIRGANAEAAEFLAAAAEAHDAARLRVGTGIRRAVFRPSPYPDLAVSELALGREGQAWSATEKGLARSLADLLIVASERELTAVEVAQEDSLRRLLGDLERGLAAMQEAAKSDTTRELASQVEARRNALLAAESEWSTFQQQIAAKYPVTEGETFPLGRVQSVLSEQMAIIGWLDLKIRKNEYESWCYAIRGSGPVTWERVGSSLTEGDSRSPSDRARSFRDRLANPASPDVVVTRESRELWGERIAPLLGALEGVEKLIVIPSGAMLGVPVEVLVNGEEVFVGEMYAVSYVPSATLHTWLAERTDRSVGSGTLLVGDPPYNPAHLAAMEGEEDVLLASAELPPGAEMLRSALAGNALALGALPRLHGTRNEVAAIAAVSKNTSLLLGPEATEQELVRLAECGELGEFGTIHIATHALVDDERPERSALVLSQVDLPDPLEAAMAGTRIYDGLVTAKEIVREWDLNADLVTLSACETGLGKKVMGEGYVGFAHAFLQAGARSLLVSLWKVEDTATSLLMRRFYENWRGQYGDERNGRVGESMSKADALQEAKYWLRDYTDEYGEHPYGHPYSWSAFVLMGDRS